MRRIIRNNAHVERIGEHIRRALRNALALGNWVAEAAREQLAPALATIDATLAEWRTAAAAEAAARAAVLVADRNSRMRVCSVRDDLWTALGRPRTSPVMPQIFADGVNTYLAGDRHQRPISLVVLQERIEAVAAPILPGEPWKDWIAGLEAARIALVDALAAHAPAHANARVAKATHRRAAHLGQEALRLFKRRLEDRGLTQGAIFDIIPNAAPANRRAPTAEAQTQTS